jgi:acetyl esterase/lipase
VVYATPQGPPLRLDVWRASRATGQPPRPAILRLHGGAWSFGTRSDQPGWNRWLNALGYDVFDADYRLPPPARWRDEVGDVKCALGWVAANAARYGVDPQRIGLVGNSAGANLALLAAYSSGDPRLPASCDVPPVAARFVVNLYGPTDLARLYATNSEPGSLASLLEAYVGGSPHALPDRYALLSPLSHVTSRSPPTLTLHGEADRLVPVEHARLLDEALAAAGVAHETYLFPWSPHGFDHQPGNIATQIARAKIQGFLSRHAGSKP